MGIGSIVRLYEQGNVMVTGLIGSGKDMLMANVVVRRKKPYVSNVNYGGQFFPLSIHELECGGNTYKNFISGDIKYYEYPYPHGSDVYISDCGVYFPAQFCNELNRDYKQIPVFVALSRHVGRARVHANCQNLNRIWDKLRESSDIYINCRWCKVFFGKLVVQSVRIYELADSCAKRVPPFRLERPMLDQNRIQQWEIQFQNYEIAHGRVRQKILIYFNKSNYNTHIFEEVLKNGKK